MSDLHSIPRTHEGESCADVIFVHGLGGDPFATWWHDPYHPGDSWPFWLAEAVPEVQVHCLEYEAAPAHWLGRSMPLVERAQNVFAVLLGKGLGKRPVVFVCHSMGGLIVKQMLRKAEDEGIDAWRAIVAQTKAIVFLGTPHRGAKLSDTLFRLGKYLGISPSARDLQTHNGLLKDLNDWYVGHARELAVGTHCFYEMQPTKVGMIVPQDSGDIGVPGVPRYAVDADHGAICKPVRSDHWLCGYVIRVVREAMGAIVVPRQLPEDLPHFVGREAELQILVAGLVDGDGKGAIAAIDGMGGVGKSALAIRAARRLAAKAPDGQIYVELGGVSERPLSALHAIAGVLRAFDPNAPAPASEQGAVRDYRRALDGKQVLLLLDNAKDAGAVGPLIRYRPPSCRLIVTSREAMPFPDVTRIRLEELQPDEAVRLLRDLLGPQRAGSEELAVLAERSGYLPLALNAAVGVLTSHSTLPIATYLAALAEERDRLRWLRVKGLADLDVAAVLGFSVRQLEEDDHALAIRWSELAVFPTNFDPQAAAEIWQTEVLQAELSLHGLVGRNMVRFEPATKRFGLHDPMRELAASGLVEGVDLDGAAARHARFYQSVLAQANQLYSDGGEALIEGLTRYDLEQRNIAAGQAWAAEHVDDDEIAARLAAYYPSWGTGILALRMHRREWIVWLEVQHRASRLLGERQGELMALNNLGLAWKALGEVRRSIGYFQQALRIAREIRHRRSEAAALGNLGDAYFRLGKLRRAIKYNLQQLRIAREISDRRPEGNAHGGLGNAHQALSELPSAIEHHEKSLAIARETRDRQGEGTALNDPGNDYRILGQCPRAMGYFAQALDMSREIGDREVEALALGNLGTAYHALGESRLAIGYYKQQIAIALASGRRRLEVLGLANWARALEDLGERDQAMEKAKAALAICEETEDPRAAMVRGLVERLQGR